MGPGFADEARAGAALWLAQALGLSLSSRVQGDLPMAAAEDCWRKQVDAGISKRQAFQKDGLRLLQCSHQPSSATMECQRS